MSQFTASYKHYINSEIAVSEHFCQKQLMYFPGVFKERLRRITISWKCVTRSRASFLSGSQSVDSNK